MTVLFRADFQNTLTPEVGTYDNISEKTGSFGLEGGEYYLQNSPNTKGYYFYYLASGSDNSKLTITFDIAIIDLSSFGWSVLFSGSDSNWWGLFTSGNSFSLNTKSGSDTSLGSYSTSTWYTVKIIQEVSLGACRIKLYIDDVEKADISRATTYAITNLLLLGNTSTSWAASGTVLKNVLITDGEEEEEPTPSGILKYLNLTGLSNLVTNIKNWVTARIPTKTSEITNDSGFITSSSLPTNYVTTDTVQTISGQKTLTNTLLLSGNTAIYWNRSDSTIGTNPSSTFYYAITRVRDVNSTSYALFRGQVNASGTNEYTWYIYDWGDTSKYVRIRLGKTLNDYGYLFTNAEIVRPEVNDATSLGTGTYRWKQVCSNSYYLGTTPFGDIVTHNSSEYAASSHTHTKSQITDFPTLATVATSGSYTDLSDKPTIPTVNNATLTIQKNGTNVQTFTANASSNKTANITVPTAVSELTNDSGFITSSSLPTVNNATLTIKKNGTTVKTFTANASSNVTCNITVPTKTSDLTNDSGFLTSHQSLSNYVTLDGNQTISGEKTFTAFPVVKPTHANNGVIYIKSPTTFGIAPSTTTYTYALRCVDNADTILADFIAQQSTSGNNTIQLRVRNTDGTLVYDRRAQLSVATDGTTFFTPNADNVFYLGYSNLKWKSVYSNAYYLGTTAFGDIVTHNASEFLTSHQSLSNYSTKANTVKSLSISGKTITVTPGSGSTYTLTTQDTVYTHPTSAGNKHIPSGGAANQYLKYSASGTAVWADLPTIPTKTSELTNDSGFLTSHQSLSGYLPLTGGTLTGNIIYKRSNATRGTAPSSNVTIQHCDVRDSANNRFTLLETTYYTDMSSKIALFAYKTTAATGGNIGSIGIGCTTSGTVYTFAPTPVANDNTTKIATTAWVQTFCDTTKGYLTSHQSLSNYLTKTTNISEMGRYIDMHYDNAIAAYDYDVRLYVDSQGTAKGGGSFKIAAASAYAPAPASDANDTRIATTKWVNDKGYLTSHQSLSNYSTKANTVKSLSISGTTITVTPGSGSAYTLTTQDTVYTHPTSAGNKHIPSGGSSGQILKYSSSGTAAWSDVDFIRKPDTELFSKTAWPADGTSTISCTTACPIWIFFDITGDNTCKIKITLSNCFVIATKMCVGSQAQKQDSATYGTLLDQNSVGRTRGTILAWPWSTSMVLTTSHTGNFSTTPSFSVKILQ